MGITQTHPMANKWGQGTAGECGSDAVTERNQTNTGFATVIFWCLHRARWEGGVTMKSRKTSVKIYLLFSVILNYFQDPIKG